jgi:Tfp pilus assembly protein FimV
MLQTATFKITGVVIVSLVLAAGVMRSQRDTARSERDAARAEYAGFAAQVAESTRMAEKHAREKEAQLQAQSQTLRDQLTKEIQHAQNTQSRLVADIRSGAQRLSIAASCADAGQAGSDPAAAPAAGHTARAVLDPQAAEALVGIAADGDTAIRERNACVQQYNAVRAALNSPATNSTSTPH